MVLPDMTMPDGMAGDDADAVSASMKYSGSIQQAGTVNPFGSTKWSVCNAKDIVVTPKKDSCRRRRG